MAGWSQARPPHPLTATHAGKQAKQRHLAAGPELHLLLGPTPLRVVPIPVKTLKAHVRRRRSTHAAGQYTYQYSIRRTILLTGSYWSCRHSGLSGKTGVKVRRLLQSNTCHYF